MQHRCKATNAAGEPCSAQARPDGWCRWHAPDLAAERAKWRRRGGESRSNLNRARKALPKTMADVAPVLYRALTALEQGEMEPARASAMAAVSRALVAVAEAIDVEQRLAALEAAAGLERRGA